MRDDASYIDGDSAILSTGGGRAFSVNTSKLSKKSAKTQASTLSHTESKKSINSNSAKKPSL
jgi:hypothetical protein